MAACSKCGWWDRICKCSSNKNKIYFTSYNWVSGWYEHIDSKPIYIESKEHLFKECEKRGHIPKAFLKPRSQGKGYEIKRHLF